MSAETIAKPGKVKLPENLVFGKIFSEHVFEMDYDSSKGGWQTPVIKKLENLSIHPAAMVFHYGQALFEGLKAYNLVDGRVAMFRPGKNIERLNSSARRLCMPEVDIEQILKWLTDLVCMDKDWIPDRPGHSLYIRPFMISTEPCFGVRPADQYKLMIMLSPVGPYYPEGFKPVPIMVVDQYVRAVRRGTGEAKAAGNYAASLIGQNQAKHEGFSQVLWLDAIEHKYIEEVGAMNIFVRFKNEIATPSLEGSILPGITRMSVIQILKDWGYTINERQISIDEMVAAYDKGELLEVFGSGTAAVISSVSKLKYNDKLMTFNETEAGELALKLYDELTGIQYGKIEDRHNWLTYVD
ncbi:MAG: branched chain amino acid aminotransferase [Stygiobacter sp. RIFOXYC12_FULL_38_8]|nr:MAG: branched chain amino acid aminotransferase [Stygiobacter sp. GWC2_38_9]OGU82971.1 MAG: branched chain amino acid aminotransferase [Stygiobacter sp. RIFOXYA12_FULL_38_9]OGV08092.1 MAG: branched chain amino acid aminotransferase [Stygiobacter sp. RIFOXYB2_FULL_37_11]OGV15608.1 MAG: branched chain amino acid aminotransferase [Stygiobacter sp. RIFOXYC2_FULL_38_25]OGV16428.1 MAG: branched chain amino acid aminotransferase [Stygiobacter sp. RIFOXYA2_FULL_38_8]OGV26326.1 MAG: branched chain a